MSDIKRAIQIGEDALTDAHAHAPLPEVADWEALATIVVKALERAGLLCSPDHLHYTIEFEASADPPDGPGRDGARGAQPDGGRRDVRGSAVSPTTSTATRRPTTKASRSTSASTAAGGRANPLTEVRMTPDAEKVRPHWAIDFELAEELADALAYFHGRACVAPGCHTCDLLERWENTNAVPPDGPAHAG